MSITLEQSRTRQARIDRLRIRLDLIKLRGEADSTSAKLIAVLKGILDLLEDEL